MAATNGIVTGKNNVIGGDTVNFALLNCKDMVTDARHSDRSYIENGRVLKNGWTTLDTSNADASNPYALDGNSGNKYKIDTSLGDVYVIIDLEAMSGTHSWLKVIDATNNIVITTTDGTGNFEFNAVPYTITGLVKGDSFTISSDGTDIFII